MVLLTMVWLGGGSAALGVLAAVHGYRGVVVGHLLCALLLGPVFLLVALVELVTAERRLERPLVDLWPFSKKQRED